MKKINEKKKKNFSFLFLFFVFGGSVFFGWALFFLSSPFAFSFRVENSLSSPLEEKEENFFSEIEIEKEEKDFDERGEEKIKYISLPSSVKAVYMSQCVAGTPSFRDDIVRLIEETELNSVMIDVKDYTGGISFPSDNKDLAPYVSKKCGARDMKDFIASLHQKGIYVIARITVFQDPLYAEMHPELAVHFKDPKGAVWKDHKGLSFIDVGAKPFWDYIVTLSKEAHKIGFDEINYDYVRYPSDGPIKNMDLPWTNEKDKSVVLEDFFEYLHTEMTKKDAYPLGIDPPILSVDLFGMTTTSTDDLGIGQILEKALPYFDFIAPMVYPSHYPKGFNGWNNPNTVPYELLHFVLGSAVKRVEAEKTKIPHKKGEKIFEIKKTQSEDVSGEISYKEESLFTGMYTKEVYEKNVIRPWIQDFNYGGNYGPKEVRAQIQAAYDLGLDSWMLWAPSNRYTKEALEKSTEKKFE
jgi:hypothetical protein